MMSRLTRDGTAKPVSRDQILRRERGSADHEQDCLLFILLLYVMTKHCYLKKNLNASRSSEHPPVRGKDVKTFRWDHRLQIQNLY